MIRSIKRVLQDRRGNALAIAAAALPLVVGSAGLASDTIQWTMWKRHLQRAADSAALAGVYSHVQGREKLAGVDADLAHNNHVGYTTVREMPTPLAPYASDPHAVRVKLSVQQRLPFSSLFMRATPTITAEATATVLTTGKYCVISLEDTTETGLTYTGNATVDLGCGMATNSTGATAVDASGSSEVEASPISAVGDIPASDNFDDDTVLQAYNVAQEDPFADVDAPDAPTGNCPNVVVGPSGSNGNGVGNGSENATAATLTAGCYASMTLNGPATLGPGVYYIDGGNFSVGAQAVVTCVGCVIVLSNRNSSETAQIGNVDINGGATINMSAPVEGQPYAGILFYQDRRAIDGNGANFQNHINGNSLSSFQGAFYFPKQKVFFNGNSGLQTNCVQMVGRRVEFSGNTSITNVCPTGSGAGSFVGRTIRLVA